MQRLSLSRDKHVSLMYLGSHSRKLIAVTFMFKMCEEKWFLHVCSFADQDAQLGVCSDFCMETQNCLYVLAGNLSPWTDEKWVLSCLDWPHSDGMMDLLLQHLQFCKLAA